MEYLLVTPVLAAMKEKYGLNYPPAIFNFSKIPQHFWLPDFGYINLRAVFITSNHHVLANSKLYKIV